MNRLQKKCFVFSVGFHGLLLVILLGSAAFRNRTKETDAPILSIIPANIIDAAESGGGEPAAAVRTTPAPPQPQPQSQAAAPQPKVQQAVARPRPQPETVQPEPVRRVEHVKREEPQEEVHSVAVAENPIPKASKPRHQHEIHPTFASANATPTRAKSKSQNAENPSRSAARAEAHRLSEIENSLDHLASGVQTSGAARTIVDVPGISGGGEVFAAYRDAVRRYYYQAWIQPETGGDKSALPEARIEVARDGSIIRAELVSPSGERLLDKSVERALQLVTRLPPFPASSHDEQRVFRIQFSLELKQATG
jgi:outer membrane biosynthesis protein TonB